MVRRLKQQKPPLAFWLYVVGVALLVALSFVPSQVRSSYSVQGSLLEVVLLVALYLGSNVSRLMLVVLGVLVAIGTFALQWGPPLDPVATGWCVLALLVTGLLLTPSMRQHTVRRRAEVRLATSTRRVP